MNEYAVYALIAIGLALAGTATIVVLTLKFMDVEDRERIRRKKARERADREGFGMEKYKIAPIAYAIASCMSCKICPYKCRIENGASMSTCTSRWIEVLKSLDTGEDSATIKDEVFRLYSEGQKPISYFE